MNDEPENAKAPVENDEPKEAPADLKALESVAKGYKYYMGYLKDGGTSGITGMFGKPDLGDIDTSLLDEDETKS